MNSASLPYKFSRFDGLRNHGKRLHMLVRDRSEDEIFKQADHTIDLRVRSGDYFVTLATELDELNRSVEDYATRAKLEDIISELIHLQDRYAIEKISVKDAGVELPQ